MVGRAGTPIRHPFFGFLGLGLLRADVAPLGVVRTSIRTATSGTWQNGHSTMNSFLIHSDGLVEDRAEARSQEYVVAKVVKFGREANLQGHIKDDDAVQRASRREEGGTAHSKDADVAKVEIARGADFHGYSERSKVSQASRREVGTDVLGKRDVVAKVVERSREADFRGDAERDAQAARVHGNEGDEGVRASDGEPLEREGSWIFPGNLGRNTTPLHGEATDDSLVRRSLVKHSPQPLGDIVEAHMAASLADTGADTWHDVASSLESVARAWPRSSVRSSKVAATAAVPAVSSLAAALATAPAIAPAPAAAVATAGESAGAALLSMIMWILVLLGTAIGITYLARGAHCRRQSDSPNHVPRATSVARPPLHMGMTYTETSRASTTRVARRTMHASAEVTVDREVIAITS